MTILNLYNKALSAKILVFALWLLTLTTTSHSQELQNNKGNRWGVAFDNDVLVPGSRDQDYTYGFNLTFVGDKASTHWLALDKPLSWVNEVIGFDTKANTRITPKIEYGLFGFTPEDISQTSANSNDRPYASLIYTSSTLEYYSAPDNRAFTTTLTLGVLGLGAVGELQESVHKLTDGDKPSGWKHQISEGGELTARYSISLQQLLASSSHGELKGTVQASAGYLTEASASLGGRIGRLRTPWLSFNPELTSYGEQSAPTATAKVYEHYFWAGISLKARAYNAFLQGQFRDSAVEYQSSELNQGLIEAWAGYTFALTSGYRFTYSLRGHTSEIKYGNGNRSVIWGGLQLTKTFG